MKGGACIVARSTLDPVAFQYEPLLRNPSQPSRKPLKTIYKLGTHGSSLGLCIRAPIGTLRNLPEPSPRAGIVSKRSDCWAGSLGFTWAPRLRGLKCGHLRPSGGVYAKGTCNLPGMLGDQRREHKASEALYSRRPQGWCKKRSTVA